MTDYLLGIGWLISSTLICYGLGAAIRRQTASFAQNLVVGYMAYSFILAMLIVPIQLLARSFAPLVIAVVAALAAAVGLIVMRWRELWADRPKASELLKNNYFLVIVVVALMGIYLLQTDLIWNNNNTDDGYYLVKSATLAYLADPFTTVYGTGFDNTATQFDPYQLSSIQAEMSVYIYLLGIDPVFFMRGVLNVFHYLLVAASVSWFAEVIFTSTDLKTRPSWPQYSTAILLLFAFEFRTIETWNIVAAQDLWHFNSAIWYGGSIVRVVGFLWILTPFLQSRRIGVREIATVSAISIVLISKAAAAIPLILVAGIGYLLAFALSAHRYKWRSIAILGGVLLGVGLALPGRSDIAFLIGKVMLSNVTSPVLWSSALLLLAAVWLFPTLPIRRMFVVLATSVGMMIVPEVNDIFETASAYVFVALRTQASTFYLLMILGFIGAQLLLAKYARNVFLALQVFLAAILGFGAVASTIPVYGNPIHTLRVMKEYPLLMPTDTVELSKRLETMAQGKTLDAIVPEFITLHQRRHYVASVVRTYAPHVRSISALTRFGPTSLADYPEWGLSQQAVYDRFIADPTALTHQAFAQILETYPIDVVVVPHEGYDEFAGKDGFAFVGRVGVYHIYARAGTR